MKVTSVKKYTIAEPKRSTSHAYFFPKKETIAENFVNRRNRPYEEYKFLLLDILRKEGITNVKPQWRQRCGCSCGCSPGFVLSGLNNYYKDFFIDVE